MKNIACHVCSATLLKDHVALNKKLLGRDIRKFFCLECFADYLGCTENDLIIKVEEFREHGCILFV